MNLSPRVALPWATNASNVFERCNRIVYDRTSAFKCRSQIS